MITSINNIVYILIKIGVKMMFFGMYFDNRISRMNLINSIFYPNGSPEEKPGFLSFSFGKPNLFHSFLFKTLDFALYLIKFRIDN